MNGLMALELEERKERETDRAMTTIPQILTSLVEPYPLHLAKDSRQTGSIYGDKISQTKL